MTAARQAALGLQDVESIEKGGEAHAILGLVNRLKRGAEEWHARCGEWCREVQRRLASKLHKCGERRLPLGRFGANDLHDGLGVERLKVEARRRVEVGRDRFGITVHHYRRPAAFRQSLRSAHGAVVELNPLPNAHWP